MKDKLTKFGRKAGYYRLRKTLITSAFILILSGGTAVYISVSEQIKAAEAHEAESEIVSEETSSDRKSVV